MSLVTLRHALRLIMTASGAWVCLASQALGTCNYTTITAPEGGTHAALQLTDPVGEQEAIFDASWGGMLASLQHAGVERLYRNHTIGLVRPWFFHYPGATPYVPIGTGDKYLRGAVTLSAGCASPDRAVIITALTDFHAGDSGYTSLLAVKDDALVTGPPAMYNTPYVLTTDARFVPNPLGSPAYYLKLEQVIANAHPSESFAFSSFWLKASTPPTYIYEAAAPTTCAGGGSTCASGTTPYLAAGRYLDPGLTQGIAIAMSPQRSWTASNTAFTQFTTDSINPHYGAHLATLNWSIAPRSSRRWEWFVLSGSWQTASAFAERGLTEGLTLHPVTPCRALDTRNPGPGALAPGEVRTFSFATVPLGFELGECLIPTTARAVVANLTAVPTGVAGSLSAFPAESAGGVATVVHYKPTQARAAITRVALNLGTALSVRSNQTSGTVHVIIDVTGYYK